MAVFPAAGRLSQAVNALALPVNFGGDGRGRGTICCTGVIVMNMAFATGTVKPPERLAAWRDLVNRLFLPLAITPLRAEGQAGDFDGSVTASDWGGLRVWRVRASPMSAVRSQRHIESSTSDDYLLALHVSGSAHAAQDGRQVTLGPGDFALFDSTRPYSIAFLGTGTFELAHLGDPALSPEAVARASYISVRQPAPGLRARRRKPRKRRSEPGCGHQP